MASQHQLIAALIVPAHDPDKLESVLPYALCAPSYLNGYAQCT